MISRWTNIFMWQILSIFVLFFIGGFKENRDQWQQPERIMDSLEIHEGMVIGEVGAGNGYFTFKLAQRVSMTGHIYANDIVSSELKEIAERCIKEKITHITTILGKVEDPLFPLGQLDLVVMMLVFHDLEKPVPLINNIIPALKAGARLVIIDPDVEKVKENRVHFFSREKVLSIMKETKFELVAVKEFLPRDNIYIFQVSNR